MTLAFITDLHIDRRFEYPYGIDSQENFLRILKAISKTKAEKLIIGGDLCYRKPEEEIYSWIFEILNDYHIPNHIICGNHDDVEIMSKIGNFQALVNDQELYYARKFGNRLAIFLDSSKSKISKNQMKWLERQLYQHKEEIIVFMHHPPISSGVPYMDKKYSFEGGDQLMKLFENHAHAIPIFTGHYHVEKLVMKKNVNIFINPSCFFQIDQSSSEFKVDHHRIAYRLIELDSEGLKTSLHYIAGSRQMDS